MSVPNWPDAHAAYEDPSGDEANRQLWQQAIDDAQEAAKLTLHRSQGAMFYLEGMCPRCGHFMGQILDFSVTVPTDVTLTTMMEWLEAPVGPSFDVVCTCTDPHEGRPADKTGCGWGHGLDVAVELPAVGTHYRPSPPPDL